MNKYKRHFCKTTLQLANKHMLDCLTLAIIKTQIKPQEIILHHPPTNIAIIKDIKYQTFVRAQRNLNSHALPVKTQNSSASLEKSWAVPQSNVKLPYNPAISILYLYPREMKSYKINENKQLLKNLYTNVHTDMIHDSQKLESLNIHPWMNG